jgi:hypothetical protein
MAIITMLATERRTKCKAFPPGVDVLLIAVASVDATIRTVIARIKANRFEAVVIPK